jgi:hypothetical protein
MYWWPAFSACRRIVAAGIGGPEATRAAWEAPWKGLQPAKTDITDHQCSRMAAYTARLAPGNGFPVFRRRALGAPRLIARHHRSGLDQESVRSEVSCCNGKAKGGAEICAHFCAHHQTRPSATEWPTPRRNHCRMRHSAHSVAISRAQCKLLISRAAMATNQKVGSSNLSGRAIAFPRDPSLRSGFRQRAPASSSLRSGSLTPAKRLKFESLRAR